MLIKSLIKTWFKKYTLREGNNSNICDVLVDIHFRLIQVKYSILAYDMDVVYTSLADIAVYCSYDYMNALDNAQSIEEDDDSDDENYTMLDNVRYE